ncbi:hypothetical protein [Paractinoplanes brasiliensis]|uniref:Uncharacterized protein n=1 Tax=Paractinoplanes brasiliensis TaxID=52695 RepID=A0A4R6JBD6_9ACTN|nr:hypothetical protein [Actinoplanes brasiliensis]TDO31815.1 hypothetical protein C8E87_7248 [Actinoplanes brasiliensis]GID30587.1 hypothetical protein Abr02nite_55700 [Actinoplanes brasiliensis]
MNNSASDRNTQYDDLIDKTLQATQNNKEIDRGSLEALLRAGRDALLGETTVHTVVHGRRDGEEAAFTGRIGRRIGPVAPPTVEVVEPEDGDDEGPTVQINIWVRR